MRVYLRRMHDWCTNFIKVARVIHERFGIDEGRSCEIAKDTVYASDNREVLEANILTIEGDTQLLAARAELAPLEVEVIILDEVG